jgi:GMP synthase (glutamine-hydrolysing)
MKKVLVIQNDPDEGLGLFELEMKKADVAWDTIKPYSGDVIPQAESIDTNNYLGLIVLGGPMAATDEAKYPYLKDEVRLIGDFLERKLPMLNICLGAQLLARACGVDLSYGTTKEYGWQPIELIDWYTQRNPLFFQLPLEFSPLSWHQDSFEIPIEGYRLARSEGCLNQAFCINGNAYGLQFHVEVTEDMCTRWIEKAQRAGIISSDEARKILSKVEKACVPLREIAHFIFVGFETTLRDPSYRKKIVDPEEASAETPEGIDVPTENAPVKEVNA